MKTTVIRIEEIESYEYTPEPTGELYMPTPNTLKVRTKSGAFFLFEGAAAVAAFEDLNEDLLNNDGALTIGED